MNTPIRRTCWTTGLAGLVAFALLVLPQAVTPQTVAAQTSDAEWALNPMGPFADERVQLSMRLQMDAQGAAEDAGVTLSYHGGGELPPAEDADILLQAAGLVGPGGQASGIVIERPCRAWAAEENLAPVATALGEELSRVWEHYGVSFPPCGLTDDPAMADILVFPAAQPPAEVDLAAPRPQGSFLGIATPSGAGEPGAGTGGADPAPAQGGSLGEEDPASGLAMAVGGVLALVVLLGGRQLTGARPA